jgi:hypothetical protein
MRVVLLHNHLTCQTHAFISCQNFFKGRHHGSAVNSATAIKAAAAAEPARGCHSSHQQPTAPSALVIHSKSREAQPPLMENRAQGLRPDKVMQQKCRQRNANPLCGPVAQQIFPYRLLLQVEDDPSGPQWPPSGIHPAGTISTNSTPASVAITARPGQGGKLNSMQCGL